MSHVQVAQIEEGEQGLAKLDRERMSNNEQELTKFLAANDHMGKVIDLEYKHLPKLTVQKKQNTTYIGQLINEKRHGKGLYIMPNNHVYFGDWENDIRHGTGVEYYSKSSVYEGGYVNDKAEGRGTYIWQNGDRYEGDWINGMKHGKGVWQGVKGDYYMGDWQFGRIEGEGEHISVRGDRYLGNFENCLKHGKGREYFKNGDYFRGSYYNGKPEGEGEYKWKNGSHYTGQFKNGLRHGSGKWVSTSRKPYDSYEGQYINDKKCGYGCFTWATGTQYRGNYFNDLRQGYGEMYWSNGEIFKGFWDKGNQAESQKITKIDEQDEDYESIEETRKPNLQVHVKPQKAQLQINTKETRFYPQIRNLRSNTSGSRMYSRQTRSTSVQKTQPTELNIDEYHNAHKSKLRKQITSKNDQSDFSFIDRQVDQIINSFENDQRKSYVLQQQQQLLRPKQQIKLKPWKFQGKTKHI